MNQEAEWDQAPIWGIWLELTRLQWSGKIAFDGEIAKWHASYLSSLEGASVKIEDCGGTYETSLDNHLAALSDQSLFCGLIFLRSYGLMERHAKHIRFIIDEEDWSLLAGDLSDEQKEKIDAINLNSGIESWAEKLITDTGQSWDMVYQGKAGLVELSVFRNALTHGYTHATAYLLDKAQKRGSAPFPIAEGESLTMTFELLHEYRGRIRSFCRVLGDGVVHRRRGTHNRLNGG